MKRTLYCALLLGAVTGAMRFSHVLRVVAARSGGLGPHDKAYYRNPQEVQFVRPGLTINIASAKIASDGTVSVNFQITDAPRAGTAPQPLDIDGINTPGPISLNFLIAYIPNGQSQYMSYITRTATAASGGATATQAAGESMTSGTLTTVTQGEYVYTFHNKAPTGFDPMATHRVGIYGSRDLSEFDMGTNYDDSTFDFVPAGGTPVPRDIVRTADCNSCHDSLAAHGGSRKTVGLCIMCHTPQTSDPNTGNTLDMKIFIHKIHDGSGLPSVQAGTPYQIIGFQNSVNDWSTVVYPADVRRCQTCHNPKNGAAQTNAWLTTPTAAACGSCHDNVHFASGQNHPGGPQVSDSLCSTCHIPQGDLPFDASIMGGHTIPDQAPGIPGINFTLANVANGVAGKAPTVTFTVRDNNGNGIPMSNFSNGGSLSLTMAGPTSDYGYTSFGSDVTTPGYVTESVAKTAQCSPDGTCSYTFMHSIPSNATGTYTIGIEGRLPITLLPGTTSATSTTYAGFNQVLDFSVDGSPVTPRRTIVQLANCEGCHSYLEVHGGLRNNVEYCVLCHNPSNTDVATRANAQVPADKAAPPQGINFDYMIHRIHLGADLPTFARSTYVIVGFGGSHNDFGAAFAALPANSPIPNTGVRYPAMDNTGNTQHVAACYMCHVNGSEAVLPIGKNAVTNPSAPLNPAPAVTSACTSCHALNSDFAHAVANTDPTFGESCNICHGTGAAYSATAVHAQ
ncbi:MAG TPA: OmcA/MtrC family decaheme c-type cytochrome [Bryobacteraceae bacterium]